MPEEQREALACRHTGARSVNADPWPSCTLLSTEWFDIPAHIGVVGVTVVCTRRFCHDAQEDHKDRYEQRIAGEVRKLGAEVRPS